MATPARCTPSSPPLPPSCARLSPLGEGLQVLVCASRPGRPVRPHLRLLRQRRLQHPRRQGAHHAQQLRWRHLQVNSPQFEHNFYRDLISYVETQLRWRSALPGRCPGRAWPHLAAREVVPDHATRRCGPEPRAALAAGRVGERPAQACCSRSPGCPSPHQPATGQDRRWANVSKTPS